MIIRIFFNFRYFFSVFLSVYGKWDYVLSINIFNISKFFCLTKHTLIVSISKLRIIEQSLDEANYVTLINDPKRSITIFLGYLPIYMRRIAYTVRETVLYCHVHGGGE